MTTPVLLVIFFALCAAGIVVARLTADSRQGTNLAWFGAVAALALACAGVAGVRAGAGFAQPLWLVRGLATTLVIRLDPLAAVFLAITGLVLLPAAVFAGNELNRATPHAKRAFAIQLFALFASIGLIFIAGDALLFLLAWEVMSVLCYLLIAGGGGRENGHAGSGYLLLAMGEAGTLAAAIAFLLLGTKASSLEFTALKSVSPVFGSGLRWTIFLLSFFGFGVKAGLVPVNFWLPRAYVAAPRAFVPVLAGATLNLGLYGIIRINADLLPALHAGPGLVALVVGTVSALLGILYATTDNDLKLMLAHSSIENVGIVIAAFGAGMVFLAGGHSALAAIAYVAALYHLINHSLYKTLLFFGAGAVESQTGTRDMDRLGGLIKAMPLTALAFLVGALAIAGLPPLNGFVSEWLTLQTMLRSAELGPTAVKLVFALCGAGLALTAALAVTCFVKVFAMSFLGMRRLGAEQRVVESNVGVLGPMFLLALLCLAFGVLPTYVIPKLDLALQPIAGASGAEALVPPFFATHHDHGTLPAAFMGEFHDLGAQVGQSVLPGRGLVVLHRGGTENPVVFAMSTFYMLGALVALLVGAWLVFRVWFTRGHRVTRRTRWDGGVRRLLPEMTYTATAFSNPVRVIFDAVFRPTTVEDTRETVAEHFRTAIVRDKERVHIVDKLVLRPVKSASLWFANGLAALHHGRINAYLAYALLALLVAWIVFSAQVAS